MVGGDPIGEVGGRVERPVRVEGPGLRLAVAGQAGAPAERVNAIAGGHRPRVDHAAQAAQVVVGVGPGLALGIGGLREQAERVIAVARDIAPRVYHRAQIPGVAAPWRPIAIGRDQVFASGIDPLLQDATERVVEILRRETLARHIRPDGAAQHAVEGVIRIRYRVTQGVRLGQHPAEAIVGDRLDRVARVGHLNHAVIDIVGVGGGQRQRGRAGNRRGAGNHLVQPPERIVDIVGRAAARVSDPGGATIIVIDGCLHAPTRRALLGKPALRRVGHHRRMTKRVRSRLQVAGQGIGEGRRLAQRVGLRADRVGPIRADRNVGRGGHQIEAAHILGHPGQVIGQIVGVGGHDIAPEGVEGHRRLV
ncbi:hypothetical protein OSCT_3140 [Oscillochloris trichoides DG-6]|uniref:Uncharacterized protein n=1 Tax=Oscillochloris trichoides DG-6 TaxID=765420 RepID=E1III9_9CHLR|nr:hypothetical protein OSCT_3140 [Oscillochloris trichoides DG-6]